jgi:hypothetical protein
MHEAHHGTEHFELYLGMLLRLGPGDGDTIAQLVDAAEHMGNWVDDVPPWFDWQSGLFRSSFFGADGVRLDPGMELNIPDHLRCVNISLLAHRATAQSRYLELATLYAGRWADAILADERLPIGLTVAGPIYDFNAENEAVYRSYMGEASALALPVDRAESFLTSDAINTFLYLGDQSGEERFVMAVRRLLDALSTQLTDPDAGAAADAIRTYRCRTMDSRYDEKVLSATAGYAVDSVCEIGFESDQKLGYRPSGVGKRSDMPVWLEDGVPRRHNPITLAVAAELNRDETQAIQAVDLARAYFLLARQAFPDGRDHGCAARTVSAIARGHGRENNAGVTTAVLMPMLAWT